jgi:dihydroorotate dehydrogenase
MGVNVSCGHMTASQSRYKVKVIDVPRWVQSLHDSASHRRAAPLLLKRSPPLHDGATLSAAGAAREGADGGPR